MDWFEDEGEAYKLPASSLLNRSFARIRSVSVPICSTISRMRVAASAVQTISLPTRAG